MSNNKLRIPSLCLLCAALLMGAQAQAEKPDHVGQKAKKGDHGEPREQYKDSGQFRDEAERPLSDLERQHLRAYYADQYADQRDKQGQGHAKALPKGLQKKLQRGGELPPGWQKKLARGEVLSDELRAVGEPLPAHLSDDLLGRDRTAEIIRIQDKVLKVTRGEGTIVDIIDLADILLTPTP